MNNSNYIFKGLQKLNTIEKMQDEDLNKLQIENIVVLPFFVNTETLIPFLMYGLNKIPTDVGSKIEFIYSNNSLTSNTKNVESIVDNSNNYFKSLLDKTYNKYEVIFKGLLCKGGILFLIYHLDISYINVLTQKNGGFILATITEILNEKSIENMKMHEDISGFFSNTMELCILHSEENKIYETPSIFYTISPISKVNYDAIFGPVKIIIPEYSVIPYYYFSNYEDATDMIDIFANEKNIKYGIIRHAVFLNKHIVILDDADYKKWNEDYYDSALILEDAIINNTSINGSDIYIDYNMLLAVKKSDQFTTLFYRV